MVSFLQEIMRTYKTAGLHEQCNILGTLEDTSPVKIARPTIDTVLEGEKLHYHKTGHEYYFVVEGIIRMQIGESYTNLGKDDLLHVEPGEFHRVVAVVHGPASYLVFNTNKDPLDKVVVE